MNKMAIHTYAILTKIRFGSCCSLSLFVNQMSYTNYIVNSAEIYKWFTNIDNEEYEPKQILVNKTMF